MPTIGTSNSSSSQDITRNRQDVVLLLDGECLDVPNPRCRRRSSQASQRPRSTATHVPTGEKAQNPRGTRTLTSSTCPETLNQARKPCNSCGKDWAFGGRMWNDKDEERSSAMPLGVFTLHLFHVLIRVFSVGIVHLHGEALHDNVDS